MNDRSFLDSFSRGFSRVLLKSATSFVNDADFPSLSPFSSSFNHRNVLQSGCISSEEQWATKLFPQKKKRISLAQLRA
jgi:hypothetical protein